MTHIIFQILKVKARLMYMHWRTPWPRLLDLAVH